MDAVLAQVDADTIISRAVMLRSPASHSISMAVKLATFFITLMINIAVGVAVFFFMLLAMNGYSESDASYGLVAYIVLAVLLSLLMSSAAALSTHMLIRREFRSAVAALLSIGLFSIVGIGLTIVCGAFGVAVAEFVRVNY